MKLPVFEVTFKAGTRGLSTYDVSMNGEVVANLDTMGEADSYVLGARSMYETIFEPNDFGETPVIYFP